MEDESDLSALGLLIEGARKEASLSQNAVARLAGISGTAFRRIIKGTAVYGEATVAYPGKPATVARIADAIGLSPEQLEAVGRGDAADALRDLIDADIAHRPGESDEDHYLRLAKMRLRDKTKGPVLRGLLESWEERDGDRDAS